MRNALRLSPRTLSFPSRRGVVQWLVVLSVAAALSTWRGSVLAAVIPVVVFVLGTLVVTRVRRRLHRASALIDTILREELHPARPDGERPRISR